MDDSSDIKSCYVIGNPIEHSLSPQIHNAAYEVLKLKFSFKKKQVLTSELEAVVTKFKQDQVSGVSVTLPHKESVIPFLDEVDSIALAVGAVNTITIQKGRLIGSNTDIYGVVEPLKKIADLRGKRALILGAGGAARSAICGLKEEGVRVSVTNRTQAKAEKLAEEFSVDCLAMDSLKEPIEADIIVNATKVGMYPKVDDSPLEEKFLSAEHIVFDLVYNPRKTQLLRIAEKKGCTVISGLEMFIYQAAKQFEMYTENKAPLDVMRRTVEEIL